MLALEELHAGYGETRVIHGLSLAVQQGEVLAVLGRNGAGKTTTLRTIMGLIPLAAGRINFEGASLAGRRTHEIAQAGIAYVPETRDIFPSLTVRENLELAARRFTPAGSAWTMAAVLDLFPQLAARQDNGGAELSGGEQQMLAIARALLMNPKLLILDEPTEGLAPIIVGQIHAKLDELRRAGLTMLLVEQNFGFATSLADRVCIIGRGALVWHGTSAAIRADHATQARWLGL